MKASDINLQQLLEFRPSEGKLLLGRERMLLFRQDAMVVMRQLAQEHLGLRAVAGDVGAVWLSLRQR
jgi:rsbT co-antagonist protein RsbR